MLYVAYKYHTALGKELTKLVICKDGQEYEKMREKIKEAGYELIEFYEVFKFSQL